MGGFDGGTRHNPVVHRRTSPALEKKQRNLAVRCHEPENLCETPLVESGLDRGVRVGDLSLIACSS